MPRHLDNDRQFNKSTTSIPLKPDDATWFIVLVMVLIMIAVGAFYYIKRKCPGACEKCSKLKPLNANRASLMHDHKKAYMQDGDESDAEVEEVDSAAPSSSPQACDNYEDPNRDRTSSAPAVLSSTG